MKDKNKLKSNNSAFLIIMSVILFIYAISIITMFIWGFYNSFKDANGYEFEKNPIAIPLIWHFENFSIVLSNFKYKGTDVFGMYVNSILYAFGGAFIHSIVPCLVSYIVAKFGKKFKFLNIYTTIVIVCMSISIVGSDISALKIADMFGLKNNIIGMWIMKAHFLGMYYLIFLGAFGAIPDSFIESAKIDGANNFTVLLKIMLPLVKNTFVTICLLQFIGLWNDYQTPLLYMPKLPTISYGLYRFSVEPVSQISSAPVHFMASMIVFLPILIVFCFLQKRIMGNISMGGLKE